MSKLLLSKSSFTDFKISGLSSGTDLNKNFSGSVKVFDVIKRKNFDDYQNREQERGSEKRDTDTKQIQSYTELDQISLRFNSPNEYTKPHLDQVNEVSSHDLKN